MKWMDLQYIYDIKFLLNDFQKNNVYQGSFEIHKEYNIYLQY
jgi:predicted adenine nucleotide alpha hydrolase (AANH) superfamily ATPase